MRPLKNNTFSPKLPNFNTSHVIDGKIVFLFVLSNYIPQFTMGWPNYIEKNNCLSLSKTSSAGVAVGQCYSTLEKQVIYTHLYTNFILYIYFCPFFFFFPSHWLLVEIPLCVSLRVLWRMNWITNTGPYNSPSAQRLERPVMLIHLYSERREQTERLIESS